MSFGLRFGRPGPVPSGGGGQQGVQAAQSGPGPPEVRQAVAGRPLGVGDQDPHLGSEAVLQEPARAPHDLRPAQRLHRCRQWEAIFLLFNFLGCFLDTE